MKNKIISNFSYFLAFQLTNTGFQLLILPLIINVAEPKLVAQYFIALSFGSLLTMFVNFATNTSSVIELQQKANDFKEYEKKIFFETFNLRILPFAIGLLISFILFGIQNFNWLYLIAMLSVLAEFASPTFYLLFKNDLKLNFQLNLIFKLIAIGILILYKSNIYLPYYALAFQGISALLLNIFLLLHIRTEYKCFPFQDGYFLPFHKIKELVPIVGNNLVTHLQQSIFLFSLPGFATPIFIAAYGFIDKIVGSIRLLVNIYNTSYFPQANVEYSKGIEHWKHTRWFQNRIITTLSLGIAIVFFFFPELFIKILLFGGSNTSSSFVQSATGLITMISFVPLVISLNALNVAEVLMAKLYKEHFWAGLMILVLTIMCSFMARLIHPENLLGYYPLFIESCTLMIYLFFVYKNRLRISSLIQ